MVAPSDFQIIEMKQRPDFIVIGAAKSGTTSLCNLFAQHPGICFSDPKEPRFFSHDKNFALGWESYLKCYEGNDGKKLLGEGSVHYSMRTLFPNAAARICQSNPAIKLIYIVRDPLDRIVSHWRMYDSSGNPKITTLNKDVRKKLYTPNLIHASQYWLQVNAYRDLISDTQIKIFFYEDFVRDPQGVFDQCLEFLGLPAHTVSTGDAHLNPATPRRGDTRLMGRLRQLPAFGALAKRTPASVKERFYPLSLFSCTRGGKPDWEPSTRKWVLDQLVPDAAQFLKYYGKPADYWKSLR